jgi:tetratricopeptide (TPR) repeat protein
MKTPSVPELLLTMLLAVPLAVAQQPGAASSLPQARGPLATPADQRAAALAAQRESDEIVARTYMATKRYREAADVYEKLARANPRDPSFLNLAGIAYMQRGDLRGARRWFDRAIRLDSRFADAYNNLGATWYTEKDFKRALQYYQRAVTLQPGVAGYHTNVGYAYFSLKMIAEAEQSFRRALLMDPHIFQQNDRTGSVLQDRSVADRGLFAFTMARSYAGAGDAESCATYLRRALDEGYKDIAAVHTDPTFTAVLADPNVQTVLTLIPVPQSRAAVPPAP